MRAIYPGTFDPITYGHMDLIVRASKVFDELIVAVGTPVHKNTLFKREERMALVEQALQALNIKGTHADYFDGLMIHYAKKVGVSVVIRGLRLVSDFEYEFQMALTNRTISNDIEVLFMMPSPECSYLSSSLIKEAAFLGADVSTFVPVYVQQALEQKRKGHEE